MLLVSKHIKAVLLKAHEVIATMHKDVLVRQRPLRLRIKDEHPSAWAC